MKHRRPKFTWLTLVVLALMTLAACGGTATVTTAPSGSGAVSTAPATAVTGGGARTTAAAPTPAAGSAAPPAGAPATGTTGAASASPTSAATAGSAAAPAGSPGAGGNTYGFKPGSGSAVDQVEIKSPIEITFWHTQTGSSQEKLKKLIADFEAKNPNIKIKAELQPGYTDLYKKVLAAATGGGLPDLAVSYESMVSEYQAAGAVIALDDYVNSKKYGFSAADLADFYPSYITSNQYPEYKGQLLSFPFTKSVLALYYNADKLNEAGIAVPKTWDEFAAACKKFTGDTKGYAIGVDASTFDGAVYSNGGELIKPDQSEWLFNGPAGVTYLTMLQDLVKSGCAYQIEKQYADQTAFGQGKAVFTFGSTSGLQFYKRAVDGGAKFNWNIAVIPHAANVQPVTTSYGANITVFKSTPEKQLAAWEFIKFFTSAEVNAEWSTATGYLPVRKSAADTALVKQQFDALPPYKVAVTEIQQYGRPETSVKGTQDTRKFIEDAIVAAIGNPNQDPKQILDDAVKKGNTALKDNR